MTGRLIAVLALSCLASPAWADEKTIELKPGSGKEVVETNCGSCHSLDYILTNAPFLTAKVWDAEVTKMIKAYGAPIEEGDAKKIVEYLTAVYGGS
jgi:sulfite dehydrogenase (cytochrome) subunit B